MEDVILKKIVSTLLLTFFLLVSVIGAAFNIRLVSSEPRIWIVDDDGPADFHTIQEAIDAAGEGDTVFVRAGTYFERITLNKNNLNLIGEGAGVTVIDAKGWSGSVVYLCEVSNVTLSGFTLQNAYIGVGIELCVNCTIEGNKIIKNVNGISLDDSENINIRNNTVSDNKAWGIYIQESANNLILKNYITKSREGIFLTYSRNNTLRDNLMVDNDMNFGVFGNHLYHYFHNIDASNEVNGKPVYYLVNEESKTIPLNAGYVAAINCTDIIIEKLNLSHNKEAILLAGTKNSMIQDNNITNTHLGISLLFSSFNLVCRNSMTDNDVGIFLWESDNNTIEDNKMYNNEHGIFYQMYSSSNIIRGNTISSEIRGNIGIYLWGRENVLYHNTIMNMQWGLGFYASYNNLIYNNNFINNVNQATGTGMNIWDNGYPSGGNYWSDYNGTDLFSGSYQNITGSDGIGDAPYVIDENNVDRYPLMKPWAPKYELAINSTPVAGVPFSINGTICYTPFVEMLSEGSYLVEMSEIYDEYVWCCWLEDGDTNRTKLVRLPPDCTLTAVYTPISWEYVFHDDIGRNTTLKVSVDDHYFRFIAPNKTFPVKYDSDMIVTDRLIFIDYEDDELILQATAIVTQRWSLCIALAVDVKTGTKYVLLDLPDWFSWRLRIW